jgi:DNA-binding CsgD family transcriptional regulator
MSTDHSRLLKAKEMQEQLLMARDEYFRKARKLDELAIVTRLDENGSQNTGNSSGAFKLCQERAYAFEQYRKALDEYAGWILGPSTLACNGGSEVEITTRERQVLGLIAAGNSTKEIASELGIAFKTAACHRNRLLAKLGARNTADLTRAAIRMGLVEP